jgi:hypothetical protein
VLRCHEAKKKFCSFSSQKTKVENRNKTYHMSFVWKVASVSPSFRLNLFLFKNTPSALMTNSHCLLPQLPYPNLILINCGTLQNRYPLTHVSIAFFPRKFIQTQIRSVERPQHVLFKQECGFVKLYGTSLIYCYCNSCNSQNPKGHFVPKPELLSHSHSLHALPPPLTQRV